MKKWYFSLKDSEGGGISEIKIQKKINKTEHSEIKHSKITTTTQFQM